MASWRSAEGPKSWLTSMVDSISGMWDSMKSSEGDVHERRSSSAHEKGSSSVVSRIRRRSTGERVVSTDGERERIDDDNICAEHTPRPEERSSFSFLSRIKSFNSDERTRSKDCPSNSSGEDSSVHGERSWFESGSLSCMSQIKTSRMGGGRDLVDENDLHGKRSSLFQSTFRSRSNDGRERSTNNGHDSLDGDHFCERRPSQEGSPFSFLSRIKRRSNGDYAGNAPIALRSATTGSSDGVAGLSGYDGTANTSISREYPVLFDRFSSMDRASGSVGFMANASATSSDRKTTNTVVTNPRKRVYERETPHRSEDTFLLETICSERNPAKKMRGIPTEHASPRQAPSRLACSVFARRQSNFVEQQSFSTFVSSTALDSPRIDRSCGSPKSLSSKTKSILDGLDKVGGPAMNSHEWRFTGKPEQWASDLLNSSVQKLPASTVRAVSRGNVVSDAIYESVMRHKDQQRGTQNSITSAGQQTPQMRLSSNVPLSIHSMPQLSSMRQSTLMSSERIAAVRTTVPPKACPARSVESVRPVLDYDDWKSASPPTTNNFSAKWAELDVVRREDSSTQTTNTQSRPITTSTEPTRHASLLAHMENMFVFSSPQRRAPSDSPTKENAHTASNVGGIVSGQLSSRNGGSVERDVEVASVTHKKAALDASLQKGAPQGSQDGHVSEEMRTAKPREIFHNGSRKQIANADGATAPPTSVTPAEKTTVTSQWSCKTCFISNKPDVDKCIACGESRGNVSGTGEAASDEKWYCKTCFVSNSHQLDECSSCGTKRGGDGAKNESFCKQCFIKIAPGTDKCASCGVNLKTSVNASAGSVFGNRAFKPAPVSGSSTPYVFGLTSSLANSSSQPGAKAAPISFGPGTSAPANVFADANVVQEEAGSDAARGSLMPRLGVPTSSSTPDVGTISEHTNEYNAKPENISGERKVSEVQANDAQSTPHVGAPLVSASGTMAQAASVPFFPTLTAPTANKQLAPVAPLFGSANVLATSTTTATVPATSAFNFGGTSETHPGKLFGFTTSGSLQTTTAPIASATTVAPSFTIAGTVHQEDESDSRGSMASNSVEMSPAEPPTESAAAPVQPFSFEAAANTAQTSELFNFGASAPMAPTTAPSTGGLFSSVNRNGALGTTPAAPFQFNPAPTQGFSAPSTAPPVPPVFNFGASSTTNGNSGGFSFGSTATPAVFNFGAQPGPAPAFVFGSSPSVTLPAFGAAPTATANFFASGSSTNTTTTRKMLKARRNRR